MMTLNANHVCSNLHVEAVVHQREGLFSPMNVNCSCMYSYVHYDASSWHGLTFLQSSRMTAILLQKFIANFGTDHI